MRALDVAFGLYALVCLSALTWPGYAWLGNRVAPRVLGLPLSLAWNVGWIAATFVVLVVYHRLRTGRDGR
ncbi:MAG TPA: DUF3311 domain-containing protein [Sandaracinaceae bacterium LLY-WYZ-13_1]|nr:DUF3311 domain-containing protein [Sandaracinaceae bacterium LLY-WYZ-13_1]